MQCCYLGFMGKYLKLVQITKIKLSQNVQLVFSELILTKINKWPLYIQHYFSLLILLPASLPTHLRAYLISTV